MHIAVVLGTGRAERSSEQVYRAIIALLSKNTLVTVLPVDVRDHLVSPFTHRVDDDTPSEWRSIAERADGFIFVIPEYNHGYPGEWKLLMDSLYKKVFEGKVASLVGVSSGAFGGTRAAELASLSLVTRGMIVLKDVLHFPYVEKLCNADTNVVDEEQQERIETFLKEHVAKVEKYHKVR